jgi:starvation-inducible DNA-binding protein
LHLKFEELYTDLLIKVDEVAERVLTLGETPLHTFQDYLNVSEVGVVNNVSSASGAVKGVLDALKVLLVKQRELLALSGDANDEGTNALMSDYIKEQEKLVWMYSSYLKKTIKC